MMPKRTAGFTLIEVLVALLILSFGMLGVGAALLTVHRSTSSSYLAQQSVQLASDILERMRQNGISAQAGTYDIVYAGGAVPAPPKMCDPTGAPCTGTNQAAYDLWQWLNTLNSSLPGANATIVVTSAGNGSYDTQVTVSFDDTPAAAALGSPSNRRAFQLETLL